MKCFETNQESQECKIQETNQISQSNQNRFGNSFLNQMLSTEIDITGYASPEWSNPKGESPEELNESLAWERADSVEAEIEAIFQSFFSASSNNININNHGGMIANENDSKSPEDMRKASLSLIISSTNINENQEVSQPKIAPDATCDWAIKLDVSKGFGSPKGLYGPGGTILFASLKNKKTNQEISGFFTGLNLTAGFATPGISNGSSDSNWVSFKTQKLSTFEDFEHTPIRYTSASIGVGIKSASQTYISFLMMGDKAQSIDLSGFGIGAIGAELTTSVGMWNTISSSASNQTTKENNPPTNSSILLEQEVFFDKGSSEIKSSELNKLQDFVTQVEVA